jgi:hypothetical protein
VTDPIERFLDARVVQAQRLVCERYGVRHVPTRPDLKIGINLDGERYPINGLRQPLDTEHDQLTGWWIWNGERIDSQRSFSALEWNALHAAHLADHCPDVLPYLGLPPGWRFLIAADYEDVWHDPSLLRPQ